MAPDPLDQFRLTLMQQVLPVGIAVAERLRRGGAAALMDAFDGGQSDPLDALRQEGEPAATRVRAQLDQVSPGLGNPVMPVQVRELDAPEGTDAHAEPDADPQRLPARLAQIEACLAELERRLQQNP